MTSILAFGAPGPGTLIVILIIAVLLFGKRLPEIGRTLGKGVVEFKKGLKGLEDDMDTGGGYSPRQENTPALVEQPRPPQRVATTAPKFEDAAPNTNVTTPPKV